MRLKVIKRNGIWFVLAPDGHPMSSAGTLPKAVVWARWWINARLTRPVVFSN